MDIKVVIKPSVVRTIVIENLPKHPRFLGTKKLYIDPEVIREAFDHLTSEPLNEGYVCGNGEEEYHLNNLVALGVLRAVAEEEDFYSFRRSKKFRSFLSKVPCLK